MRPNVPSFVLLLPPCPAAWLPGCHPAHACATLPGSRLLPPCLAAATLAQAAATRLLPCPGFSQPAPATWLLLPCSCSNPAHPAVPTLPQLLPGCCCHPAPATATGCCHPAAATRLLPPGCSAATRLLCCHPATWMLPSCPSFCHPAAATRLCPSATLPLPGCCKYRQPYHPCPTCCTATPATLPSRACPAATRLLPLTMPLPAATVLPSLLTRPRAT